METFAVPFPPMILDIAILSYISYSILDYIKSQILKSCFISGVSKWAIKKEWVVHSYRPWFKQQKNAYVYQNKKRTIFFRGR
jgi:hypothetical protein